MGIEERIERLEQENRSLKRVTAMLLAGIVGTGLVVLVAGNVPATIGLLFAATVALLVVEKRRGEVPEVIRAQKIEVVGADGVTRVALGETLDGSGAVATYDAEGRFIAALDDVRARRPHNRTGKADAVASYAGALRAAARASRR
jgi:hypothetical protein